MSRPDPLAQSLGHEGAAQRRRPCRIDEPRLEAASTHAVRRDVGRLPRLDPRRAGGEAEERADAGELLLRTRPNAVVGDQQHLRRTEPIEPRTKLHRVAPVGDERRVLVDGAFEVAAVPALGPAMHVVGDQAIDRMTDHIQELRIRPPSMEPLAGLRQGRQLRVVGAALTAKVTGAGMGEAGVVPRLASCEDLVVAEEARLLRRGHGHPGHRGQLRVQRRRRRLHRPDDREVWRWSGHGSRSRVRRGPGTGARRLPRSASPHRPLHPLHRTSSAAPATETAPGPGRTRRAKQSVAEPVSRRRVPPVPDRSGSAGTSDRSSSGGRGRAGRRGP